MIQRRQAYPEFIIKHSDLFSNPAVNMKHWKHEKAAINYSRVKEKIAQNK